MNDSKSAADSAKRSAFTYNCTYLPEYSWNNDIISSIFTYVVTCLACPFTILLNTLIIIVIARTKSLQSNTNILLCSMAVADLLVGAVYQPLSILNGALYLREDSNTGIQCTLDVINTVLLYAAATVSICHQTAIARQRNARVSLDLINAASRSRKHIKILLLASWTTALISPFLWIMMVKGVNSIYLTYLDISASPLLVICLVLTVYYYISIYVKTRNIKIHPGNPQNIAQTAKVKMEKEISLTTGLLTLTLFLCYTPSFLILFLSSFSRISPGSSYFLWAITMVELNSLANPILYCFRNRKLRTAILELLRVKKWEYPLVVPNIIPLQDLQRPGLPQGPRAMERSMSWGPHHFNNNIHLATNRRRSADM